MAKAGTNRDLGHLDLPHEKYAELCVLTCCLLRQVLPEKAAASSHFLNNSLLAMYMSKIASMLLGTTSVRCLLLSVKCCCMSCTSG